MNKKILSLFIVMTFVVVVLVGCGKIIESQFPLPETVNEFTEQKEGDQVNYQADISSEEVMNFYKEKFTEQGLTERELLTVKDGGTISIVFDGHEKGSIVVQAVELPTGGTNVNVRFEEI